MNKLSDFFIPSKLSAPVALTLSQTLTKNVSQDSNYKDVEMYTAIVFLQTSWEQEEQLTLRGFCQTLEKLNTKKSIPELVESLMKEPHLFRDPNSGSVSLELIGVRAMILQYLYALGSSATMLQFTQKDTENHFNMLFNLPEEEEKEIFEELKLIKNNNVVERLHTTDYMNKEILKVVQGGFAHPYNLKSSSPQVTYRQTRRESKSKKTTLIGPSLQLYDRDKAVAYAQKMSEQNGQDGNAVQKQMIADMANDTGLKPLAELPVDYCLNDLYNRFPHFEEVLDFISARLALAACGSNGRPVKIAPMLLKGPPGTGKTYFAQELAKTLGLYFEERDLSITSEAFVIAGMDCSWKNSKPGVVFNTLMYGPTANPLICLNEIDKCSSGGTHNSPISTLHWLLEPTSSNKFQDEFIPIPIRADHVIWVLTANDGYIPEPIQTRLEIFDIQAPDKDQCKMIAVSVWKSLCEREFPIGHGFSETLTPEVLEKVSAVSPRVMRKTLTHAAANAIMENRRYILAQDCEFSAGRYAQIEKRAMGF